MHENVQMFVVAGVGVGFSRPDARELKAAVASELRELVPPLLPCADALDGGLVIAIVGFDADEAIHGLSDLSREIPCCFQLTDCLG